MFCESRMVPSTRGVVSEGRGRVEELIYCDARGEVARCDGYARSIFWCLNAWQIRRHAKTYRY